ncbi:hypothetical protein CDIK_4221 [Cucumispora dikerogammari]|nr:hypothetical protein CDIK_4221 [Cucumispora dikerogammari]
MIEQLHIKNCKDVLAKAKTEKHSNLQVCGKDHTDFSNKLCEMDKQIKKKGGLYSKCLRFFIKLEEKILELHKESTNLPIFVYKNFDYYSDIKKDLEYIRFDVGELIQDIKWESGETKSEYFYLTNFLIEDALTDWLESRIASVFKALRERIGRDN